MEIKFSDTAQNHLNLYIKSGNKKALKKITQPIYDIQKHPYNGVGKPEQLKHNWSGYWSTKIIISLIYRTEEEKVWIYSLMGHSR